MSSSELQELDRINNKVIKLQREGRFKEAVSPANRAVNLSRRNYGEQHQKYANCLINLATLHVQLGNYSTAVPFFHQALDAYRGSVGETHAIYATCMNNLAYTYEALKDYDKAVPLYRQAIDISKETQGDLDPDYALSLMNLAFLYVKLGNKTEAEPLYEQALEIFRKSVGDQHPDYAKCLNNLAGLYTSMGKASSAEPLQREALEIKRTSLGEQHPEYANGLNDLALTYKALDNYSEAESLFKQSLEIRRQVFGEAHPDYIAGLNHLESIYKLRGKKSAAELIGDKKKEARSLTPSSKPDLDRLNKQVIELHNKGRYEEAITHANQAVNLNRHHYGEQDLEYAKSLHNLASMHVGIGNYSAAVPLFQQALEVYRGSVGETHADYATSLNNLAYTYEALGNYDKAEPRYRQALEISRETQGELHPDYAQSLMNLAFLNDKLGNEAEAEPLYEQSLEIYRKSLGDLHPDYAKCLNNLAGLYTRMGKASAAEPLQREALQIKRKKLGEMHPEYANGLSDLAITLRSRGKNREAEPLYRQALEIRRQVLGEQHPDFAASLHNLAGFYRGMGNFTEAEPLYRQAVEIMRYELGENHPDLALSLSILARMCAATKREDEALNFMKQTQAIHDHMLGQIFSIGSEDQRMAYLETLQTGFDVYLSLIFQYFQDSSEAIHEALELILRRKAIGAEALAAQREAVLGGQYPELVPKLHQLTELRMDIAEKTLAGPGNQGVNTHHQILVKLNAQKNRLEADLARKIPEMNLEQKLLSIDRASIAQILPRQTVLVEFVRFRVFNFKRDFFGASRYLAFTIPSSEPDKVAMIDLGPSRPIDRMIAQLRRYITESGNGNGRGLGSLPVDVSQSDSQVIGDELRKALFDPLIYSFGNSKRLLLAPDGDLTRLPFEVLPTGQGRYLIDEYQISYLGTGRDVLRFDAETSIQPGEPLLVADPDFDLGSDAKAEPSRPIETKSRELRQANIHFGQLPATRMEGERIGEMLGVQPWIEGNALEARLKSCRSPCILHLATHGFFLEDQKQDRNQESRGLGAAGSQDEGGSARLSARGLENPLLRSGLALAGANTWLKNGSLPDEAEDGILTAEDVSGLDLLATEMVVLSACETGLGEIQTGEGVFGLRRAFVLAGAKTLVMSLWKVPDKETQELMEDFYRRILQGQSRAEALREAQLMIRDKHPDPLYWGAFICQGDPSPIYGDTGSVQSN